MFIKNFFFQFNEIFPSSIYCIGASELGFCARKWILNTKKGIKIPLLPKMVLGKILHPYIEKALKITLIEMGIPIEGYESEKSFQIPLKNGVLRCDCDVYCNVIIVEIKTKDDTQKILDIGMYIPQIMIYLGYNNIKNGLILILRTTIFRTKRDPIEFESYFSFLEYLDKEYVTITPVKYDEKLYKFLIEKAELILEIAQSNTENELREGYKCPEYEWECKKCIWENGCPFTCKDKKYEIEKKNEDMKDGN